MGIIVSLIAAVLLAGCTSAPIDLKKPSGGDLYDSSIPYKCSGDIRIMSYNIHFGVGTDNKFDIDRDVETIKKVNADIIVLNEVDRHYSERSNYVDMPEYFATALGMNYVYESSYKRPASSASGGKIREVGNVILSHYPIEMIGTHIYSEGDEWPRIVTKAKVTVDGGKVITVAATHFGLTQTGRIVQSKEMMEYISENMSGPVLICGDLNAIPSSQEINYLYSRLTEAFGDKQNIYTFSTTSPSSHIDYIFANDKVAFKTDATVIQSKVASDHFPIMVDFTLK